MSWDQVGKWAPGTSYGPVLSQTDLYLLGAELEVHPVLARTGKTALAFDLLSGHIGAFSGDGDGRIVPFGERDQPATLPRVAELHVINAYSPWCTTVKNPNGITISDLLQAVWKDFTEHTLTEAEWASLNPRLQSMVQRAHAANQQQSSGNWGNYFSPTSVTATSIRRVDWLRERIHFDSMGREDGYVEARLGFKAPNVMVIRLSS